MGFIIFVSPPYSLAAHIRDQITVFFNTSVSNHASFPIRLQTVFPVTSTETEQFRGKKSEQFRTTLAFSFS